VLRHEEARGQDCRPKCAETQPAKAGLYPIDQESTSKRECAPAGRFKFIKGCREFAHEDRYLESNSPLGELLLCQSPTLQLSNPFGPGSYAVKSDPTRIRSASHSLAERKREIERDSQSATNKSGRSVIFARSSLGAEGVPFERQPGP
jgi:hypothetical protein